MVQYVCVSTYVLVGLFYMAEMDSCQEYIDIEYK